jgi:hypothetical protein
MNEISISMIVSIVFSFFVASFILSGLDNVDYKIIRLVASTFYISLIFYPWSYCYIVLDN